MQEFRFNYCIPREYKDKENGEIRYCLCRGGEKMEVDTLDNIQKHSNINKPKDAQPWIQIFNNGFRVTNENLNWEEWTGFTWIDIDSKWFYKFEHPFDVNKLLNAIIDKAPYMYNYNYYCCHLSNSKQGYRIFWYWNCEKTEENFKKCCLLTEQYTRNLFYSFGNQAKEIIDYKKDKHKVLDNCSRSIFQGSYVTINKIYYSQFIEDNDFGACNLEDISLEQIYQTNNIIKTIGSFNQKEHVKLCSIEKIDSTSLHYYPHSHRRCIYEALIVLFDDKIKVDEEWKRIANLLPETDGMNGGHNHSFYEKEPNKNRWYDRFNKDVIHNLNWLDSFGYRYTDNSEYVYYKQFRKSWKHHINNKVKNLYIQEKIEEMGSTWDSLKKDQQDKELKKLYEETNEYYLFDKFFDDNIKNESRINELEEYRRNYYKTRWENKDFKYLCNGYDIPKDIVTYKMYADFYYRDKNNLPTIKYDILEDDIKVLGYWPETNKIQYHPFKYGNEYTHWKNNDTFCNSCTMTDLLQAINKYVPRWHNYHTIKDYLNSLDLNIANEELLETWAIRYFDAEDSIMTREICKKFFIAAVKKQMVENVPSFAFQHMLFLQGASGCGKTFFLVTMFTINGENYILNKIDPNGKDNEIGPLIAKNWLIQFGESESLKKVSVNAAKEFMDRINLGMKYQKKYENEQTTIYPRIMACRTSNDDVLFNDVSINDGDRRNWLIVCRTGINSCDEKLRNLIKKEKDILWATAYKLYLDNPEQELELSNEAFSQLASLQEDYKLIKNDDVEEVYNEIFEREYLVNGKGYMQDEDSFKKMLEKSDVALHTDNVYVAKIIDDHSYCQREKVTRIPARWLNNYISNKFGISFLKLFKDCLKKHGYGVKSAGYNDTTLKCWLKI